MSAIGGSVRRSRLISEVMSKAGRREGLVPKKVTVQKKGKTFQQTVYVRPGEKPEAKKEVGVTERDKLKPRGKLAEELTKLTKRYGVSHLAVDEIYAKHRIGTGKSVLEALRATQKELGRSGKKKPTKGELRAEKEPAAPKLSMSSVRSAVKSSKDYATSAASAFAAGNTKDGVNYLKGMSKQLGDITYDADKAGLKIDPKVGEKIARLDDEILSITQAAKTGTPKGNAEAARGRAEDVDEIVKLLSPKETAKSGASMIMRRNHLISNSRF